MRNPFHSEPEALDFLLLVTVLVLPVAIAIAVAPTWLAIAVGALALGALVLRGAQRHSLKRRGIEIKLISAPAHVGPGEERRILLVANDTLGDDEFIREAQRLASAPDTRVLVLAPALISSYARLTGDIDRALQDARVRLAQAVEHLGGAGVRGEISDAEPLEAVEDAVATFAPDEIIIVTRGEMSSGGLDPRLAGRARTRFALPVDELVIERVLAAK